METQKNLKVCEKGHQFYRSSDCPTCPVCEEERRPKEGFLAAVSAPARRALEREGIITLDKLSTYSKEEVLKLHGVGPGSIPKLQQALKDRGLSFNESNG